MGVADRKTLCSVYQRTFRSIFFLPSLRALAEGLMVEKSVVRAAVGHDGLPRGRREPSGRERRYVETNKRDVLRRFELKLWSDRIP